MDRKKFKPFKTGVGVLSATRRLYPDEHIWKNPPYEYEREKLPIDILAGTDRLRIMIDAGETLNSMEEWWQAECTTFSRQVRKQYLIYD